MLPFFVVSCLAAAFSSQASIIVAVVLFGVTKSGGVQRDCVTGCVQRDCATGSGQGDCATG